MKHLVLDAANLFHRAKGGFQKGDYPVVFNFFRGLKPIIERFRPDGRVYVVLEGYPEENHALLESYKANRRPSEPAFIRQCNEIVSLLSSYPVTLLKHAKHEADDVIFDVCSDIVVAGDEAVVVSSDSDFTQLTQRLGERVVVWNWRTDEFVAVPEYDYITWKALRGDATDNIPRVPGVTEASAIAMAKGDLPMDDIVCDTERHAAFQRNRTLVTLNNLSGAEKASLDVKHGSCDWQRVKTEFERFGFRSMLKDTTFEKYTRAFGAVVHDA